MKQVNITREGKSLRHYAVNWEQNENTRDFLMKCGQLSSEDFVILSAFYPVEPLVRQGQPPVYLKAMLEKIKGRICYLGIKCRLSECKSALSLDELAGAGLRQFGGDYLQFSFGRSGWKNPGTGINYRLHFNIRSRHNGLPDGLNEYDVEVDNVLTYYGDLIPKKDAGVIIAALNMLGVGCRFNGQNFRIDRRIALLLTPQKQADMYKFATENGLETAIRSTRTYFSSAVASQIEINSELSKLEFDKGGLRIVEGLSEKDMEDIISYFEKIDGTPKGKEWAVHFLGER